VWLDQHPSIGHREVDEPARRKDTPHFVQVMQLRNGVADVLDHVIGKDDVERRIRVGQGRGIDALESIAIRNLTDITDVDCIDRKPLGRMRAKIMRYSSRTRTDLKQANATGTLVETQQAFDLRAFVATRTQVQDSVTLSPFMRRLRHAISASTSAARSC
jgi:hypothetical protein